VTPMKTVSVSGRAYEPNAVTVTGEPSDSYDSYTLYFDLTNYTEITAIQLDIDWLDGMTTSKADMALGTRASGHSYEVAMIQPGKYRVIIFSMSNTPFTGNEGDLFDITFHGTDFVGSQLAVSDIKLSGIDGKNYTSPDASLSTSTIEGVKVTSITLDHTTAEVNEGETFSLVATIEPANAYNKAVKWESSDTNIASVDDTGVVTVFKKGECKITATTTDGTDLSAECFLTVLTGVEAIFADDTTTIDVYNINGMLLYSGLTKSRFAALPPGMYIVNGLKVLKR